MSYLLNHWIIFSVYEKQKNVCFSGVLFLLLLIKIPLSFSPSLGTTFTSSTVLWLYLCNIRPSSAFFVFIPFSLSLALILWLPLISFIFLILSDTLFLSLKNENRFKYIGFSMMNFKSYFTNTQQDALFIAYCFIINSLWHRTVESHSKREPILGT